MRIFGINKENNKLELKFLINKIDLYLQKLLWSFIHIIFIKSNKLSEHLVIVADNFPGQNNNDYMLYFIFYINYFMNKIGV